LTSPLVLPCYEISRLAQENAKLLGLQDRCHFELVPIQDFVCRDLFDVIVSNPPYIPSRDMDSLAPEILLHEDERALRGGEDGLNVIRAILDRSVELLRDGGDLLLEVDPSQPPIIEAIARDNLHRMKLSYIRTGHDFNGFERFCHLRRLP